MTQSRLELNPGDIVFREGEPPTSAFLIEEGRIEVFAEHDGTPFVLGVLGPGDLLGEMAVIDAAPRTATARALTAATLIAVDGKQISERIENSDPIVRALFKGQLARYRQVLSSKRGQPTEIIVSSGGQRVVDGDGYDDGAMSKIRLETQLRDAIATRTLEVRFQPIYEIALERIAGYEALVRWTHPERGPISPVEFIALAEETSLILPVGQYVLDRVAEALAELQRAGVTPLPFVAVNMSGRQFAELDMLVAVREAAARNGIDPRSIKIEVTESLTLDVERVAELISRARLEGVQVALDDFGTGYSNLGHLHKLMFNTVKLDQGFVRQMLDAPRCRAIVRAIVAMVHALEADLVAEGVETRAQLDALAEMNCRYAQGYLIGRPQTFDEMLANHPT
jgi:EAL domain-containing protein (putative c-di-GMP-specific phosphodiesterase class I)